MDSLLQFAVFATEFKEDERALIGIHNRINAIFSDTTEGIARISQILYVAVIAVEGNHVLHTFHSESDQWNLEFAFEILPEHGYSFLTFQEADFPVYFTDTPIVNDYPLFLDDEPLGSAYLIAHRL